MIYISIYFIYLKDFVQLYKSLKQLHYKIHINKEEVILKENVYYNPLCVTNKKENNTSNVII